MFPGRSLALARSWRRQHQDRSQKHASTITIRDEWDARFPSVPRVPVLFRFAMFPRLAAA